MSTDPGDAGALRQTLIHQRYKLDRRVVVASNRVVQDWGSHPGGETIRNTRYPGQPVMAQPDATPARQDAKGVASEYLIGGTDLAAVVATRRPAASELGGRGRTSALATPSAAEPRSVRYAFA